MGASVKHLRYIASPQAVRDGAKGVWLKEFPQALTEIAYPLLVQHLCQTAQWLEQEEIITHRGKGEVRTHYQAILSFEAPVTTCEAKQMLASWIQEVFPKAQAAAFVHCNTKHLHIHIWIPARQIDGRKINLSARAFRQLDESWNRIYCRAMNRDEQEHLLKKGQTERWKQLRREGKETGLERPQRVGHEWKPALFNERERERLGSITGAEYDPHQKGTGADKRALTEQANAGTDRERGTPLRDSLLAAQDWGQQQAMDAAERALSETEQLRQDAQSMAEREQPERTHTVEQDREQ